MENNNEIEQLNNQLQILNLSEDKECSGEIFKQIKGYSNYEITNKGIVRNIRTKRILKQILQQRDQSFVVFIKKDGGRQRNVNISRLVALAFLDNPKNLKRVRHKSRNLLDNSVENLYFV